jgi:hypothetical protein
MVGMAVAHPPAFYVLLAPAGSNRKSLLAEFNPTIDLNIAYLL